MDASGQKAWSHLGRGKSGDSGQYSRLTYVPTEDERRILYECNEESFWYRALPLSVASLIVTYGVTNKGIFTRNSMLSSLPKALCIAAVGFVVGKASYMSACKEKFKTLENSPIGESLRQGIPLEEIIQNEARQEEQGLEYPVKEKTTRYSAPKSFGSAPVPEAPPASSYSDEYSSTDWSLSEPVPFSASLSESSPTGITEHNTLEEPVPLLEESPKRKRVSYEELRNRNRETHEILLTQKAETPVKSSQERPFKKEVKLNKYGDVWEE